jgi:ankyrin repeat protein
MRLALCLLVLSLGSLSANGGIADEPLAKASRVGDLKTVETLLASGVNPDLPDRYGKVPLYYAASFNEHKVVELLLAYHADPNAEGKINGHRDVTSFPVTPLQCAAYLGNLRITSTLISAGAHIDAKEPAGRTALHFAVSARHLDVMRYLIEKGADVNTRDAEGASPLDDAVWSGSLDSVAILLAHGARLNEPETKTGATPINEAAFRGNTQLVRYLLEFHPDLEIPDKRGFTPLENSIRMRKEDSALLLLGAEPKGQEMPQFFERTMDAAIRSNAATLVEALLQRGASANAGPSGSSPLEDASLKGFDAIVNTLLDHGAVVNQLNIASGTTALYAAASFGKSNVVRLLLDRGANPNLCGKNGKTPYQAAVENGYTDVAAAIRRRGGTTSCQQE